MKLMVYSTLFHFYPTLHDSLNSIQLPALKTTILGYSQSQPASQSALPLLYNNNNNNSNSNNITHSPSTEETMNIKYSPFPPPNAPSLNGANANMATPPL